jgi:hypothetical protein
MRGSACRSGAGHDDEAQHCPRKLALQIADLINAESSPRVKEREPETLSLIRISHVPHCADQRHTRVARPARRAQHSSFSPTTVLNVLLISGGDLTFTT